MDGQSIGKRIEIVKVRRFRWIPKWVPFCSIEVKVLHPIHLFSVGPLLHDELKSTGDRLYNEIASLLEGRDDE